MNYDMKETLRMRGEPAGVLKLFNPTYPTCCLVAPHNSLITNALHEKITRFDSMLAAIHRYYKSEKVEQWAKVQQFSSGDDMKASTMDHDSEDHCDATYIRYDVLVDINAQNKRQQVELELQTFYGQLQNIFVVHFPATPGLGHPAEQTYFLAGIQVCDGLKQKNGLKMTYYKKMGCYEVVDMSCVQCLVGRVRASDEDSRWAIIDCSGAIQRSYYVRDDPGP
ncbi:hypothetical protein VKT23_020086 [Stygiomarasmius scandens]|uniref:Uncharacterized protein n=1 Tax=Marasmiellus scandens TaxID=2682957 RepID=A0ABR1ILS0_9AGAR